MRSVTGIELGVDSCVIARVRSSRETVHVSAVHGLYEADWNAERTLCENLRDARRSKGFPRRARVVAWGLEHSGTNDLATNAAIAPLTDAGFLVEALVSPADALTRLAQQRPRAAGRQGAAWLSLNRHGAAIAIVHEGELLYSREFDWRYRPATTVKEDLLQRYSLVAHLAPEIRHGIDVVRAMWGVAIDVVVTCGDLPDLRSLTMPLIEELDIEVETLDTLDGMTVVSPAGVEEIAERAPAMRLACAAATITPTTRRAFARRWIAAAAALVLAVLVWAAAQYRGRHSLDKRESSSVATRNEGSPATPAVPSPQPVTRAIETSATAPSSSGIAGPTAGVRRGIASDRPQSQAANVPAATTGQREPLSGVNGNVSAQRPRSQTPPAPRPGGRVQSATPPAGRADAEPVQRRTTDRPRPSPVPLKAPLPVVNSILVAPDRRLAVVDGEIVREGERVGPRVLIRIEPAALVLREPSGYEVRVPIRRKPGSDFDRDPGIDFETNPPASAGVGREG